MVMVFYSVETFGSIKNVLHIPFHCSSLSALLIFSPWCENCTKLETNQSINQWIILITDNHNPALNPLLSKTHWLSFMLNSFCLLLSTFSESRFKPARFTVPLGTLVCCCPSFNPYWNDWNGFWSLSIWQCLVCVYASSVSLHPASLTV